MTTAIRRKLKNQRRHTVVKPDVVLICDEPNDKYITKTPEIIIEVISPATTKRDEVFKFDLYEKEQAPII